jgi:hypothetical protein
MGLDLTALTMLKHSFPPEGMALSLGYPDLPVRISVVEALFDISLKRTHPSNAEAMKRHMISFDLPDTEEVFQAMGSELRCVDYKKLMGNEIVADLNLPCDLGQYALVIDPGTLEHCFNVMVALKNAAGAVMPGGRIFHCNPISMVNHGFYQFCPTWYFDFYQHNGWKVIGQKVGNSSESVDIDPVRRVRVAQELSNYVLASRPMLCAPLRDDFPIQSKYRAMLA